jgi:hypothetical protein
VEHKRISTNLENTICEVVDFYRGFVLDTVEQEIGGSSNWLFIRARLLKALGDRGLIGRIREVIQTENTKAANNEP